MTGNGPALGTRSLRHTPSNAVAKYDTIGKKEVEEAKFQPKGALQPLKEILADVAWNYQK